MTTIIDGVPYFIFEREIPYNRMQEKEYFKQINNNKGIMQSYKIKGIVNRRVEFTFLIPYNNIYNFLYGPIF